MKRILFVEDSEVLLQLYGILLADESDQWETTVAPDGQAAMELLRRSAFDVVVSDMQMPGMSGVELLIHLRGRDQRVPFIFITAFPDEHIRARAFSAGALGVLIKPFDKGHLIACLEQALRPGDETADP